MGNSCSRPDATTDDDPPLRPKEVVDSSSQSASAQTSPRSDMKAFTRQPTTTSSIGAQTQPNLTSTSTQTTSSESSSESSAPSAHTDPPNMTPSTQAPLDDQHAALQVVAAHDLFIRSRSSASPAPVPTVLAIPTPAAYTQAREELARRESVLAFDHPCASVATPLELRASRMLSLLRQHDNQHVFAAAPPRTGLGGQLHPRFAGDHFLGNEDLIACTELFRVAQRLPKGAHLHVHFNACLLPGVLLGLAVKMERMYMTSNVPLIAGNWDSCMLEFSILRPGKELENPGNVFAETYEARQTMQFSEFLKLFPAEQVGCGALEWLESKVTFKEEEAHDVLQTVNGAWDRFNGRTRMMKGLFNYETAFRTYIRLLLVDFARDNIQYAEIRPNFMKANQLFSDDGTRTIDNVGIMEIIISATSEYLAQNPASPFRGLKVIYCTPRVFDADICEHALRECIEFKQRWPEWIAGFDLVGEECRGHSLAYFAPRLLQFRHTCHELGLDIPFLFHCGESTDAGSEADGNLLDALLLGARRIGHGFALPRHPYIMEHIKARGVCLELCPISNEILGLTPRIGGHAMYSLLANNVHCTISSDNGTLFRSSLSHDFYQAMVGKQDMTLLGWKQLIEWSLEHACLSPEERKPIRERWERDWAVFVQWIVDEYGSLTTKSGKEDAEDGGGPI